MSKRLKLPLVAAPMYRISGPDLVIAACKSGVVGAFPTLNASQNGELEKWLERINRELGHHAGDVAPWCANLIVHRERDQLMNDVETVIRHGIKMAITSVGSPEPVLATLKDAGCQVFVDVGSVRHARSAVRLGADGLVLLTAGSGGQTGWLNGFAFIHAVRQFFDGPLILAGGICDGRALWAARVLGYDLAYMGTKFIATRESMGLSAYKEMLVASTADDIILTRAITGLPANILRGSLIANDMDPSTLDETISAERARELFGASRQRGADGTTRWRDIWSAGHSVAGVSDVPSVEELVDRTLREYQDAREATLSLT